ncbi:Zn-dependent protease, contains TPR repeats OS=Afipia felis OX=1035 GN=NCTC12722_02767 PE=4 SV=1 [Afipia felis]
MGFWASLISRAGTSAAPRTGGLLAVVLAAGLGGLVPAAAQDASEQSRLYQQMVRNPTNHDLTFEYARVATANADYEAAIGALERLLFYNPKLTRVKYELGALYFRLGSYEMAKRYFKEALASPDLDPVTRGRIEAYLPDANKQLQPSRFSGFFQTGIRSQSNANYAPATGSLLSGGTLFALPLSSQKRSDVNWFGLAGLSHDYDLNSRGDVLETRFAGYLTAQDRFSDLNVGLFDISFGPRLALAPEQLPGATIKPYVVGGNTWIGGSSYMSSGGAGVALNFPTGTRFAWGPSFEWRHADFTSSPLQVYSGYGSGNWYTGALGGSWQIMQTLRLEGRSLYRRGASDLVYQSFDAWGLEAALTWEFAPPFVSIPRNWSISPYFKYTNTRFDAANPSIDPNIVRRDDRWSAGAILNTPITKAIGFTTTLQYDHNGSTLQNYRLNNFSVIAGPTFRF